MPGAKNTYTKSDQHADKKTNEFIYYGVLICIQ